MILKFSSFLNESVSNGFKLKDIVDKTPPELKDIFDIIKNEIVVCNGDLVIISRYVRLYECCLLEFYNLVSYNLNILDNIQITKSKNEKECQFQNKKLFHNRGEISALMLKFLNTEKKLKFINDDKLRVGDMLRNAIKSKMLGENYTTRQRRILNLEISIS